MARDGAAPDVGLRGGRQANLATPAHARHEVERFDDRRGVACGADMQGHATGGQPERAIMVGDSEVDIATAAAAGVPSIGVSFGYTRVPVRDLNPTVAIDDYREFMPALEQVLACKA